MIKTLSSTIGALILAGLWTSAAAQDAPTGDDVIAGLSVSEQFIEAFAVADWGRVHSLLSTADQLERTPTDIESALTPARRALGPLRYFLLAQASANANGCQQRRYATSHQFGIGRFVIRACPENGEGLAVTEYAVVPDFRVAAHGIFPEVLARNLGFGFLYVDCDVDESQPVDETFECEAISDEGLSLEFILRRTGPNGVAPESYEQLSSASPKAEQRQLLVAAQLVLAYYSTGEFGSVFDEASLPFRALIDRENYLQQLQAIHATLGKVEASEWVEAHEDAGNGLPLVELKATFASGDTYNIAVRLMPGRNIWRMDGLYFNYPRGSALDRQVTGIRLQAQAQRRTRDDDASIDCPLEQVTARTEPVRCSGRAYGREVTYLVRPLSSDDSPWYEDPIETSVLDFQTILRQRLETVEEQLGWQVDDLTCDNPNPDPLTATHCTTRSPDGSRRLTVINLGDNLRVLEIHKQAG